MERRIYLVNKYLPSCRQSVGIDRLADFIRAWRHPQRFSKHPESFAMSLVKIPFMIIDSYVSDKSSTPPTPPPSPDEYVKESEKHQATFWRYENRLERVSDQSAN